MRLEDSPSSGHWGDAGEHKLGSEGSNGLITDLSLPRAQKAHIPLGYEPEPRPNVLIPGWFTKEQWGQLQPYVQGLISKPGGVLLISVQIDPRRRNYPDVGFGVFDSAERTALRRALEGRTEETRTGKASSNLSLRYD